jgi:hypothetical protein
MRELSEGFYSRARFGRLILTAEGLWRRGMTEAQTSLAWRCLVCDVTSLGARLEFQDAPVLPTYFNLTFG